MSAIAAVWITLLGAIALILLGVGVWIRKSPLGILVDSRNRMSLSRLQIVAWTWLLTSAFLAVAIAEGTMNILLDPEVWALMGISVASAAGSVIVKGTKAGQEPDTSRLPPSDQEAATQQPRLGMLAKNPESKKPSLAELFMGEELTDQKYVDISKVQMFLFTVVILCGYGWTLWGWDLKTAAAAGTYHFPSLSEGLVVLLGISHAGYLTVKAAPKSPTR